jgi:hypothetical protein
MFIEEIAENKSEIKKINFLLDIFDTNPKIAQLY